MPRTFALGAGLVPFSRPASGRGYCSMGSEAAAKALQDASVRYDQVQAAVCSYNYAAPTAGQAALYNLGLTGIPIFNTNNNCSSGSTNLFLARSLILSGQYDVVLCVGFEEMDRGLSEPFQDRASPTERQFNHMHGPLGVEKRKVSETMNDFTSGIIKLFAEAGREYCEAHGVGEEIFAEIAAKNRLHGRFNENAMLASPGKPTPSAKEIAAMPKLYGCISAGMAAPTGDGAAAVVLCSERWAQAHGAGRAVEMLGQALVSDLPESFGTTSTALAGLPLAAAAARAAYGQAGIVPGDVDVVELHDCFSPNELLLYEALQLTGGRAPHEFWRQRSLAKNSHGTELVRQGPGGVVVNPSGGLESKGHPIGATGLGQAAELIAQLRGEAGKRQVEPHPGVAVQHNYGFNGGAVVTVWGAPVALPRPMTPSELVASRKFCGGWGNTEEFSAEFRPGQGLTGRLPEDLRGTFFRNGPGVMDVHGTRLAHPIDGDGLVGRLAIRGDGTASFSCRFVDTATRQGERDAGEMLFPGQMGSRPPQSKERRFRDPSHTNVFEWGGRLLACHEYTLPHELDPFTLKTLGPTDLAGALAWTRSLSAHYRYDQARDRLVAVGFRASRPAVPLGPEARPSRLHVCELDRSWWLRQELRIEIPGLDYVHDLAVTPSYYVVHQTPFVKVDLEAAMRVLSGKETPGEQMRYNKDLPCRLILIPRDTGAEAPKPILVDLPHPCHVYHFGNAYETEEGFVEIDFVGLGEKFNMQFQHELFLSNSEDEPGLLFTTRLDPASGRCMYMRQLDRVSCEFPAVHPLRNVAGYPEPRPRYTYLMANDSGLRLPFTHVVKVDRAREGRQSFSMDGCSVGEPCFVPRPGSVREDDGYLIVQVFRADSRKSAFAVLDAADLSAGPLAVLDLDRFLPNGFHGTWSSEVYTGPVAKL